MFNKSKYKYSVILAFKNRPLIAKDFKSFDKALDFLLENAKPDYNVYAKIIGETKDGVRQTLVYENYLEDKTHA